jgi:hypothetical protein
MKRMAGWLVVLCVLAGCQENYDRRMEKFITATTSNAPSDEAVWLEMQTMFGEWEKVIFVFGYVDNVAACQDFEVLAHENPIAKWSGRRYRCVPA